MTVGPFFGVRYQKPHVEVPVVSTPGTEDDAAASLTTERPSLHEPDGDDGIVL